MNFPDNIVYALVDPRGDVVRYIGQSSRGMLRAREHARTGNLRIDDSYKARWIRGLKAAGLSPRIAVLEAFDSKEETSGGECFWIAQARGLGWPITNLTKGGDAFFGYVPSPEKRAKHSAAMLGNQHTKGRPLSEEHKAKLSLATKNRPRNISAAHRDAIKTANRARVGSKLTAEHRAKISASLVGNTRAAAQRGRPKSPSHLAAIAAAKAAKKGL